jgi:hypothetical protein
MVGCTRLPVASTPVLRAPRGGGRSAYGFWTRAQMGVLAIGWVLSWKWRDRARAT